MGKINANELERQYELQGAGATCRHLTEALEQKHLRPEDFSIRDLAEALIPDGAEWLRMIDAKKSGGMRLREAATAVDTSAFSNITGQIVYNKILEGYNNPSFLWPQLCETIPTTFLDGEKIPGIGRIGDKAEKVDEGMPYPTVGLAEEFVETVKLSKRGFIMPITREIIIADRTGILLRNAAEGGKYLGINKEKRILDVALGITNNYKRNGVATNTYLTAGAYINSQTGNALADWKAIEKAELLFDALTDPTSGEPILMPPNVQLVVPSFLKRTANRILVASEIQHVDNTASATTVRTIGANPLAGSGYSALSSPYVKNRTGSDTTWFFGDFKGAFAYMEAWAIETLQAATNSEPEFTQDIMMRFKVSEMGAAQVMEPRRVTKNAA